MSDDSELAPYFLIGGMEVPNVFENRAAWARHQFISNPNESQVCDKGLVWCQNTDGFWYSVNGNYSRYSPKEKIILAARKEEERMERVATAEETYNLMVYESNIRLDVLERDSRTCQLCGKSGKTKLHVHHIMKRREGGTDHLDNLITVCPSCHAKADSSLYNPDWTHPNNITGGSAQ